MFLKVLLESKYIYIYIYIYIFFFFFFLHVRCVGNVLVVIRPGLFFVGGNTAKTPAKCPATAQQWLGGFLVLFLVNLWDRPLYRTQTAPLSLLGF